MSHEIEASLVPFSMDGLTVKPDEKGIQIKRDLLKGAKLIKVDSAQSAQAATDTAGKIKGVVKQAEAVHKQIKGPYLRVTQALDGALREFTGDLKEEQARLEREAGTWLAKEKSRQINEAQEAAEKAAQTQKDAEEKISDAETELAELETLIRAHKEHPQLSEWIARRKQLRVAIFDAEQDAGQALDFSISAMTVPVAEVHGARIKEDEVDIEITNVVDFLRFLLERSPERIEEVLKIEPRVKALKDFVFFHHQNKPLPGLNVIPRIKVESRASN